MSILETIMIAVGVILTVFCAIETIIALLTTMHNMTILDERLTHLKELMNSTEDDNDQA